MAGNRLGGVEVMCASQVLSGRAVGVELSPGCGADFSRVAPAHRGM